MILVRLRPSTRMIILISLLFFFPLCAHGQQQAGSRAEKEQQAAAALKGGLQAYKAGQLGQAVTRLKRAQTLSPDDPQVRLYLGLFLYEQNKDSLEAQRLMESVLDQFPAHGDLQLRILDSYLRSRNAAKSEALLQRLQPRLIADNRFAFNVIYTLIQHGRLDAARRETERISNSLQGEVLFIGGLIELGDDKKQKSLELLEGAVQRGFPLRDSRQMLTLAESFFHLGALPQAASAYENFFSAYPDAAPAQRFRLALCYYGYGDFARALEQMNRVRKEAPETPEVDLYLGAVLIELKKPEEAKPFLEAELKRDPASYKAMTKVAYLEYLAGRDHLCRQWLEKSAAQNPQWFESHMVYGLLHNRLGEYEEAVKSLEACIGQEPEYPKAYFQLSQAWRRLGNEEKARQYLERFNQLQEATVSRTLKARGLADKAPDR